LMRKRNLLHFDDDDNEQTIAFFRFLHIFRVRF